MGKELGIGRGRVSHMENDYSAPPAKWAFECYAILAERIGLTHIATVLREVM